MLYRPFEVVHSMPQPVFVTLVQTSRALGLPRDWLIRETSAGRIPHITIGSQVYLHFETVVDCVVEMMRRNVTVDAGLPILMEDPRGSLQSFISRR
jgi:hypothetical protein